MHKRTKSFRSPSPLYYDNIDHISLEITALSHFLLAPASDLAVKEKMRIINGVSFDNIPVPSYSNKNGSIRYRE